MSVFDTALVETQAYYTDISDALELVRADWTAVVEERGREWFEADQDGREALEAIWDADTLGIGHMPSELSATMRAAFIERGKLIRASAIRRIIQHGRELANIAGQAELHGTQGLSLVQRAKDLVQSGEYLESDWVLCAVVGVYLAQTAFDAGWTVTGTELTLLVQARNFIAANREAMLVVLNASERRNLDDVDVRYVQSAIQTLRG